MRKTFDLPDVGEGVAEGELLRWLVAPGDPVAEDQPLAQVETDKAVVDLPSPYAGTVAERHADEGETVPVGSPLVTVEVADGEAEDDAAGDEAGGRDDAADDESGTAASEESAADAGAGSDPETATEGDAETTARRVVAPPRTRRLARELGVDLDRIDGAGRRITDADVRAAARADATTHREPARAVDDATSAVDETTTAGDATGGAGGAADDAGAADGSTAGDAGHTGETGDTRDGVAPRNRTLAAPATRRLASDLGVVLDRVPTDERRDGEAFVTPAAVREYAERREAVEAGAGTETADAAAGGGSATGDGEPHPGDRIPYRGVRRSIGEQMERSKSTVPHATHTDSVDVTALVETKADLESYAAKSGVDLTYLPFVMRAVATALAEFPRVNASLDDEREEIVCHDAYNLGVATATDAGLLVPVVEDVDEKDLLDLAAETAAKVERARDRRIAPEEMRGGTFTITNLGVIGGEYATPVVNHPEVAILALGRIAERPRVVDGEVVARHTLPLSLSVDHRVVDGAVAARFTNRVMDLLARPARLLVE